ncbi:MAG: N-acetyltransferase [Spirochaetales bacterium]|nr:N-acetyltransferase [Spirochaetales bacterium]
MTEFTIRRTTVLDIDEIFQLTNTMAKQGLMLPRSKYKIVSMIANFLVVEENTTKKIVACGAFAPLWTDIGEVLALAVDKDYWGKGIGSKLVKCLLLEAKRMKINDVITLTYQAEFFQKLGFKLTSKDIFPRKLWRECLECPKLEQCDETALHILVNELDDDFFKVEEYKP